MNGPKSSFWVSSYLNQRLIISNLQNHSVQTDRQTDTHILYMLPTGRQKYTSERVNILYESNALICNKSV